MDLVNTIWLRDASGEWNGESKHECGGGSMEEKAFVRKYRMWEEKHGRMGLRTQKGENNMWRWKNVLFRWKCRC